MKFWMGILYWGMTESVGGREILSLFEGSISREKKEQERVKKKKETFLGEKKRFLARKIEKEERGG